MGTHQHPLTDASPADTSVIGVLNYLLDTGVRPVNYAYAQPEGKPQRTGVLQPTQVQISDARRLHPSASLDVQGFAKVEQASAVTNLEDEQQVRGLYYAEVDALLRLHTGAVKTVIFDHTIRRSNVTTWR